MGGPLRRVLLVLQSVVIHLVEVFGLLLALGFVGRRLLPGPVRVLLVTQKEELLLLRPQAFGVHSGRLG